jgi:protein TonB
MKNQPVFSNSGTLEDMVFESRNKAYGAYEMNRKGRKYLIFAFLISLIGASSAVAVPFIKAIHDKGSSNPVEQDGFTAYIGRVKPDAEKPLIPELPQTRKDMIKQIAYLPPLVVEDAPDLEGIIINEDLIASVRNYPVDSISLIVEKPTESTGIDEKSEEITLFPQERATFMGGDESTFRNWLVQNINYPVEAAKLGVFGKVIVEFCVNSKGKVVDVKFLRSLDPLVDNEVLRVLSSSPVWVPAKQGGSPVKTKFTIPINFQMQ